MKNYTIALLKCLVALWAVHSNAQWSSDPAINLKISTNSAGDIQPEVISDGSGGVFIVWMLYHNEVMTQHLDANGNKLWNVDGVKAFSDALMNTPREFSAIADGTGGVIVVWEHGDASNADIRAQRIGSNGTVQWGADGIVIAGVTHESHMPKLVSDNQGGAIAVWRDRESGDEDFNIYAQRLDADGNIQWAINGIVICDAIGMQKDPVLIEDGNDGAFIAWNDSRSEGLVDVYTQHIDALGLAEWTANGLKVNGANTTDTRIWQVIMDNSGSIIFLWANEPDGYYTNIHFQKLNTVGEKQWGSEGLQLGEGQSLMFYPRMIRGNGDKMILTWEDVAMATTSAVFAQQLNSDGEPVWDPAGVHCATPTGFFLQHNPAITSDGNGGAIISFTSLVAMDDVDLYAQHINSDGVLMWGEYATVLSTGSGSYSYITSDGAGGAIVTWFEARELYTDIYAQNICANAQLGICTLAVDDYLSNQFATIYPNPNTGKFTIESEMPLSKVTISDAVGKVIIEWVPDGVKTEIDLNVVSGIYFVRMVSQSGETVKKVVIN